MPDQTANRIRWDTIPILGKNPVFCFEARRLWTRRTILIIVAVAVASAIAGLVLDSLLRGLAVGSSSFGSTRTLRTALRAALPPAPPVQTLYYVMGSRQIDGAWFLSTGYLFTWVLIWPVAVAMRYVIPALAASAVTSDRAQRRLGPLLVTQMSPGSILFGKLAALIAPVCIYVVTAGVASAPLSLKDGVPASVMVLWPVFTVVGLFPAALIGLRVGAQTRHPATAVGLSILLAGVVLPLVARFVTAAISRATVGDPFAASNQGDAAAAFWLKSYVVGALTALALYGLISAPLWYSAKRALARAAE